MKKIIVLLLSFVMMGFMLVGCGSQKLSEKFKEEDVKAQAEKAVELFTKGDFKGHMAMYNEKMAVGGTEEALSAAKEKVMGSAGEFKEYKSEVVVGSTDKSTKADQATAVIVAQYENQKVTYSVTFDTDMKISGFYLK